MDKYLFILQKNLHKRHRHVAQIICKKYKGDYLEKNYCLFVKLYFA